MSKAVVVFSGGQDSTTCLAWAKKKYDDVLAVSFDYGQKHYIELERGKLICQAMNIPRMVIPINYYENIQSSTLLNNEFNEAKKTDDTPATMVPGRNLLLTVLTTIITYDFAPDSIILGVSQVDYSGYYDCRSEFIESMEQTLSLAFGKQIKIETPLMHLSKAETWQLAYNLGNFLTVLELSHTCYEGVPGGCHECDACKLREAGLVEFLKSHDDLSVKVLATSYLGKEGYEQLMNQ